MAGVPLLDLTRQHAAIASEVAARVGDVFTSQQFILGRAVEEFEQAFAGAIGAKFAVGMSSGTDAELALLMAMEIGAGDAVLTTPYTFFATAGCIARVGAEPVFLDIEEDTFNLDPEKLSDYLKGHPDLITDRGNRIRAVIPVHLFGLCAKMDEILDIAGGHGLAVIEDAAQAVGTRYSSRSGAMQAGTIAGASWFSFFPTKNLGGAGDGGMAVCEEESLALRLRQLRNHGMTQTYHHEFVGGNFRLDALQAAVLMAKLPRLDKWNAARIQNAATYRELLAPVEEFVKVPSEPVPVPGGAPAHTYHQFVIRARRRDELKAALAAAGIGHAVYYPIPLHLQPCFANLGYRAGALPVAERASQEALALPIFPELTAAEIGLVAETVVRFYRG
ncbi:MAG: DegT/DnrJ/EryC1/StrS family aminotransferase [Terrimicrobiaceae bacterium]